MIVPCMVNSWLYCSGEKNCSPGLASSARISSAIRPPMRKNANEVTRYIRPICLASVVRSRRENAEPLTGRLTGQGRVTIGFGATVVTLLPPAGWSPGGADHAGSAPQGRIVPSGTPARRGAPWTGRFSPWRLLHRGVGAEVEADRAGRDRRQEEQQDAPEDEPIGGLEAEERAGPLGRRRDRRDRARAEQL